MTELLVDDDRTAYIYIFIYLVLFGTCVQLDNFTIFSVG